MILRCVNNNRPDATIDYTSVQSIDKVTEVGGGSIVVEFTDCSLDKREWFIPFGQMIQIFH
jgi:hypothetical protein